jgi:probable rRNA maturation factor
MILLDPHLKADSQSRPKPRVRAAKAHAAETALETFPSLRALTAFLHKAQAAVRLSGEISVLLTTDEEIRRLNRQFRGKNKATDVLSFPAAPGPEKLAGDLAVSVPTALRQAAACGHSLATEIKVLILHGLLHLAGYDHEIDEGQMARRERVLRARLKLPLGLIERARGPVSLAGRTPARGERKRKAIAGPSTRSLRELAQHDKLVEKARTGRAQAGQARTRQARIGRRRKP